MAEHEHECFARALETPTDAIETWDLLGGSPSAGQSEAYDGLLVGGSGDYSVLDDLPFIRSFLDFLDAVVVARGQPCFASCFGFQALVQAGGGSLVRDPANAEVGTFEIHLTEAGQEDHLFGGLPPAFQAQLGHKDRAERLPKGTVHLASSVNVAYQALRIEGTPVVATQFHPELDREANAYRYRQYAASYEGSAASEVAAVLARMDESPEATTLLKRWAASL